MDLPVIPENRKDDVRGIEYLKDAELIVFMAGNQFMVMEELMEAFKEETGIEKIFYETLPPRLMLRQILAGGAKFGELTLPGTPDVYTSVSEDSMLTLRERGKIDDYFVYLHNRIVLMVPKGNPAGIESVHDLGKEEVRVSQPNPENEDIAKYIIEMYRRAGGDELVRTIMEEKVRKGTTLLTTVHHRETPERLMKGICDVGPVWVTEAIYAEMKELPLEHVEVGEGLDMRDVVNYYATKLKGSPNPDNAEEFLRFLRSKRAKEIYKRYGFVPEG